MNRPIDSHAHLSATAFDADREDVVLASLAQLDGVIDVATDEQTALVSLDLSSHHPAIWTAIGVHPHGARLYDDRRLDRVLDLADRPGVVALGEMGLDYHYDFSPKADQLRVFARQVDRARTTGRPIVVHVREAFADAFAVLAEGPTPPGVLHCFTGSWEEAKRALDLGLHLSFSGMVTFPNASGLRQVARSVPLDRLLIETDAPYLTPHPHRNLKRNIPAMVRHTAAALALERGLEEPALTLLTGSNTRRLFGLDGGSGPHRLERPTEDRR